MMPITKEFTIRLEDRAGTLGKLCQALAEQNNNILAYDPSPDRPVDRPATTHFCSSSSRVTCCEIATRFSARTSENSCPTWE